MLVNATFEQKTSNGILVSFLEVFKGTVINQHLDQGFAEKQQYKPNQKLKARILFVDQQSKKFALTTLTHLVAWEPFHFSEDFKLGAVLKGCKVTRLEGKRGLFVKVKGAQCYVKASFSFE